MSEQRTIGEAAWNGHVTQYICQGCGYDTTEHAKVLAHVQQCAAVVQREASSLAIDVLDIDVLDGAAVTADAIPPHAGDAVQEESL